MSALKNPQDPETDAKPDDFENKSLEAFATEVKTADSTGDEASVLDADADGKVEVLMLQHVTVDGENVAPGETALVDRTIAADLISGYAASPVN